MAFIWTEEDEKARQQGYAIVILSTNEKQLLLLV